MFTAVIILLLGRLYLQFRTDIYGLGDRWRLVLYAAVGVIVVTLAASGRLFDTGPGTLVWFALLGGAGYALYLTYRQYRSGAAVLVYDARMFTARASTSPMVTSDDTDSIAMIAFAVCVSGIVSVGLNAFAFVSDV